MKKKLLISDIARELGVSITTVSFVLNGRAKEKRISDSLAQKVRDYVIKVGYRPNELAKSLRTGKTKIIGLVIEDISNSFFSNIARLIETKAYSRGYRIIYCSTENQPGKAEEFIQLFRDRHVDAYIITPPEGIEETVSSLMSGPSPVVLFDRYLPLIETDYVVIDNKQGAFEATRHLIDQGFRRIGFVTLPSLQTQMQDRLQGYLNALDIRTSTGSPDSDTGKLPPLVRKLLIEKDDRQAVEDFYAFYKEEKLDAVLFAANHLALIGLKTFKQYQEALPGVISFDDHTHFRLSNPTITVVSQPIAQIAEEVIAILFNRLEGKARPTRQQVVLPTQLIVRESSLKRD